MMLGYTTQKLGAIDPELKEAVCDALVNLLVERVSATDQESRTIFGRSPRRAVFSGQLLPRFDEAGQEDETSDIRIAAIGMDFSVRSSAEGPCHILPHFSVYVRVLPTWDDLQNDRLALEIDFKLRKSVQQEIDTEIKARREQSFTEQGVYLPKWRELDETTRAAVRRKRSEIQESIRIAAYAAHGIRLERNDIALAESEHASVEEAPTEANLDDVQASPGGDIPDAAMPALPVGVLIRQGRKIPFTLIEPAPVPGKWMRIDLRLPGLEWELSTSDDDLRAVEDKYAGELRGAALEQVSAWFASPDGQTWAWRDVTLHPQDVASKDAYEAFLTLVRAQAVPINRVMPDLTRVMVKIERQRDFLDPSMSSYRVALDNQAPELSARNAVSRCNVLFGSGITVRLPETAHLPMRLDRVEPSYRFRDFLRYPAIGLNCGIGANHGEDGDLVLKTTWSPRFVQPRIIPRNLDLPVTFGALADRDFDVSRLLEIPRQYERWVGENVTALGPNVRYGLPKEEGDEEARRLTTDEQGQLAESKFIRRGIELLLESQSAAQRVRSGSGDEDLRLKAAPYEAWLLLNRTFFEREGRRPERGWRLFQLAFILAHIPTLASRLAAFRGYFDAQRDEDSVSLLYFPTGGGKSEAFYGTLLYNLFLDRLRGKDRGVTAMIRYPLRLLTLQQAQRLLRLLIHAEMIRSREKIGTWPFEIGFWVGASNTPNRYSVVSSDVPLSTDEDFQTDHPLEESTAEGTDWAQRARRYRELRAAYNKVPSCPVCGFPTGLRRYEVEGPTARRLGIICFNRECDWNLVEGTGTPLPFLLTDDTIYARAPSVILGTVDKLAMLGQHTETITKLIGMFGVARWVGPTGHFHSPRRADDLRAGPRAVGYEAIFPAYRAGLPLFTDPFPSLIIQDEAHLLEESLGTFSGLFDSLFENVLGEIAAVAGDDLKVARRWMGDDWGGPRMPKIIAATATISKPDRQVEVLYQRAALRFPYPGPDIYHSFFAEPAPPPARNTERCRAASAMAPSLAPEATSPWMRLYVSLMTNDATHTVTSVQVLSVFHALLAELWNGLTEDNTRPATIQKIRDAIGDDLGGDWRRTALDRAVQDIRPSDIMACVDLHRIALAYVTNKKGGDQIMDALDAGVRQTHRAAGIPLNQFDSRLISGGIDMKEIQAVMADAESSFADVAYPAIEATVRNIVATSAISHGVDVDRFNSMFFAGLPSDIAEYIQASSRVGRTHVGFVMLLPTPQSRRDRYVIETHDIFHRFLERMIAPPAVERWAENAIRRVRSSLVQAWAMTREARRFIQESDARKEHVPLYDMVNRLGALARNAPVKFPEDVGEFMLQAIGLAGRGPNQLGKPHYDEHYRGLIDRSSQDFSNAMQGLSIASPFVEYWKDLAPVFKKPMTSLRDVDEAGFIVAANYDPGSRGSNRRVDRTALTNVMKTIRGQRAATAETDNERDEE